jgi:hypothetical protein
VLFIPFTELIAQGLKESICKGDIGVNHEVDMSECMARFQFYNVLKV